MTHTKDVPPPGTTGEGLDTREKEDQMSEIKSTHDPEFAEDPWRSVTPGVVIDPGIDWHEGLPEEYESPAPIVDEAARTVSCGNCGHTYADIHPGEFSSHSPGYSMGSMCGGCCDIHPLILRIEDPEVENRLTREWHERRQDFVGAYYEAHSALAALKASLTHVLERVAAGDKLPTRNEIPTNLTGRHGGDLLLLAADIRDQINRLPIDPDDPF